MYSDKMLMTTGYSFDNYSISEYKKVIAGECVLGTGFLSDLSAMVNDFLGTASTKMSRKLSEARAYAVEELVRQARDIGANAIIGVDFDYITLAGNMLAVIANGTAVCLCETSASSNKASHSVGDESKETDRKGAIASATEEKSVQVDRTKAETICPFCNTVQRSDRSVCFKCGAKFVDA